GGVAVPCRLLLQSAPVSVGLVVLFGAALREPEVNGYTLVVFGHAPEGLGHGGIKLGFDRDRILGDETGFGHQCLAFGAQSEFNQTTGELGRLLAKGVHEQTTRQGIDRKSTRLNSSHVKISYAVFCLKKKKHKNRPIN